MTARNHPSNLHRFNGHNCRLVRPHRQDNEWQGFVSYHTHSRLRMGRSCNSGCAETQLRTVWLHREPAKLFRPNRFTDSPLPTIGNLYPLATVTCVSPVGTDSRGGLSAVENPLNSPFIHPGRRIPSSWHNATKGLPAFPFLSRCSTSVFVRWAFKHRQARPFRTAPVAHGTSNRGGENSDRRDGSLISQFEWWRGVLQPA